MMLPYLVVPKTWTVLRSCGRFYACPVPFETSSRHLNPPGDALSICSRKLNRKQEDQGEELQIFYHQLGGSIFTYIYFLYFTTSYTGSCWASSI